VQTRLAADAGGIPKTGEIPHSECMLADGTNAAAENRDFGMSRWAARY
jgi:hypothetical protein